MKITNKADLPDAIVQAVKNDSYTPGESDYTPSSLTKPPRIRALERKHWKDLEEDAADRIWALVGQVVHNILERAESVARVEERLYRDIEVDGKTYRIGAQFDRCLVFPDGLLQDYKFTSIWSFKDGVKPEYQAQLNIQAWCANGNDVGITQLEDVAIFRDWSHGKSLQYSWLPSVQVQRFPVKLWPEEQTEAYIRGRIRAHEAAKEELPECTPEERWAKPSAYAVMKKGRKSALRVLDSREDAENWMEQSCKGEYIEFRPGEDTRCLKYCPVSRFCEQFQKTQQEEQAA